MVFLLSEEIVFPNPSLSESTGLLAIGGDLSAERLLMAYSIGVFPWFNPEDDIMWWYSTYRPVYFPHRMKAGKNIRRKMRKLDLEIKLDYNFDAVIDNCAKVPRSDGQETWISKEIKESYAKLFELGFLHTVEVYENGDLVGGLYGISLGKAFYGESMFFLKDDMSKIALYALNYMLKDWGYLFVDAQVSNAHSFRMGAVEISKNDFSELQSKAMDFPTKKGKWSYDFKGFLKKNS